MLYFSIPLPRERDRDFFHFSVTTGSVLFAGSRHLAVADAAASPLVEAFGSLGFSFITGCAKGVDASFRKALVRSGYKDHAMMAYALPGREAYSYGLDSRLVVSRGVPPRAALAKRTIWL